VKWIDLKQLNKLIEQTKALGASVEKIGVSSEGRFIYGITTGNQKAARTVVILAGLHADEIIGPLAAVSILQMLTYNTPSTVRICIVPVADPDFMSRNVSKLSENATLRDLLNLNYQRDLEGNFTTDIYPECVAIRQWMKQFNRIDAYLSLHSAHCISPGLFFYIGNTSNSDCVYRVAAEVSAAIPDEVSLLSHDPTGLSKKALSLGFFELKIPEREDLKAASSTSSLAFVSHHFQPHYLGASEMPLAVCPALAKASLADITQCNQNFKQTGNINHSFRELDVNTQLCIMKSWILSVIKYIAAM
jgi:Zinc carboxypeptidase